MVSLLVFVSNDLIGFPTLVDQGLFLTSADGILHKVKGELLIAHPYDFTYHKCWSKYQNHIYSQKIIQPFRQVFREYYPITESRQTADNTSGQYRGIEIYNHEFFLQLRDIGWMVDFEECAVKLWPHVNLAVYVNTLTDNTSSVDSETAILGNIRFVNRFKDTPVPIIDVPPVVFSETMLDINTAIGYARVDMEQTEISRSTIEIRIAITRELLKMKSIDNVWFEFPIARIKGNLGDYSVHMGTGAVHRSDTGVLITIPDNIKATRRVFLPFYDIDPETSQILAVILLLANDKKIKDPWYLTIYKDIQPEMSDKTDLRKCNEAASPQQYL